MIDMFSHGPYADLHQLNLDWIIAEVNKMASTIDAQNADINEIRSKVDDFIANLDLSAEVGEKLDEMLADGSLADIITNVVLADINDRLENLESEIRLIFPSGGGESMILKIGSGAYIFDFGLEASGQTIINAMTAAGITKILGAVLSHYHDDHVGGGTGTTPQGFINVMDAFDHANAVVYLPHALLNWDLMTGDFTKERGFQAAVLAYINGDDTGLAAYYPVEGEVLTISDTLRFRFNNLSQAKFSGYYAYMLDSVGNDAGKTTYNNFSMITEIFHLEHKILYPGDIHEPAEENNVRCAQGTDIFVVEHHGLNRPVSERWVSNVTPEIAIIATGANTQDARTYTKTDIYKLLAGCEQVVDTGNNGQVVITSSTGGISCETASGHNLNMMYAFSGLSYGRMLQGSGYDLDNFTTPGEWGVQTAAQAAMIGNSPFTNSGYKLQVMIATPSMVVLQIAIMTGSNAQAIAIRRSSSGTSPVFNNQWVYLYPSEMVDILLTSSDLLEGLTVAASNFNQNHVLQYNNVIEVSLDVNTPSNVIAGSSSGEILLRVQGNRWGRGTYFVLREYANPSNVYLCRLTYAEETREWLIRNVDTLPANTRLVGNVVCMAHATN